ncbi:MAG: hypothetical protein IJN67_09960 [Oscillospiraceae bacterium]|nr:hypothetical protein [Oscillospiraceae bacterium]
MKKKLSTVKPELPKEYVWTLVIEEQEHEFKCLVTETEVITYEDGVENKHLKITDPTCLEGTLQIDTQTKIFGDMVDFQLERFIPYIRLDGHWAMSHTTENDRLNEQIAIYKKQSKQETAIGLAAIVFTFIMYLVNGNMDDWWILIIFGIFFISSAALRMVRLRNELNALKELEEQEAAEKASGNEYLSIAQQVAKSEEE